MNPLGPSKNNILFFLVPWSPRIWEQLKGWGENTFVWLALQENLLLAFPTLFFLFFTSILSVWQSEIGGHGSQCSATLSETTEKLSLKVHVVGFSFWTGLLWIATVISVFVGGGSALDSRAVPDEGGLCIGNSSGSVTTEMALLHWLLLYCTWNVFIWLPVAFRFLVTDFSSLSFGKLALEKLRKR